MRLACLVIYSLLIVSASPAVAAQSLTYDEDRASVSTPALSSRGAKVAPVFVVVCNNFVRLAYLEWPSNLGVDKNDLADRATVNYALSGGKRMTEIWMIARPAEGITRVINHDTSLPERLARQNNLDVVVEAGNGIPTMSANFNLIGLDRIVKKHNMPCEAKLEYRMPGSTDKPNLAPDMP